MGIQRLRSADSERTRLAQALGINMAVTHGHGNPNWTRDETILALDLYLECDGHIPSSADERVQALSEILRLIPYHSLAARKESFRNPDGVAFKLQNIRQVDTGQGLGNVSKMDREVWAELGRNPARTKELADLIRLGINIVEGVKEETGEYEVFPEGKVVTEAHLKRERDPKIRKSLLAQRKRLGKLTCEICSCTSLCAVEDLGDAMFEAHHILPLFIGQERVTKLKDIALLCANCHRLVHRAIAFKKQWFSIEEAKVIIFVTKGVKKQLS